MAHPPTVAPGRHPAIAYAAPMAVFMVLLALGPQLGLGAWEFPARVAILAAVLWVFSRDVIDLRMPHWPGSVALGAAVFAIWVGPDLLFGPAYRAHWLLSNSLTGEAVSSFDAAYRTNWMAIAFRAIRAVILVPVIEELFWRAFLMRWLIDSDFRSVPLGAWAANAFWITAALFAVEHGAFWEVGLLAGIAYNWWMIRTKSLGDCILAHAVTNALLSAYTVWSGNWQYW